jgi:putative tryptophan/tyrosine transport system substrate-binding protein
LGLVASLNRPGANVTGSANFAAELAPKQLQLLRELTPNAALFGVLADPANPATPSMVADLQAAARTLRLQLVAMNASTDSDLETAFANFSQQRVGAVLVGNSTLYNRHPEQVAVLAARHALPAIFPYREFALAGGLMSYGSSLGYLYHQLGMYTGRILKGEKPADLPAERTTRIEVVLNLKTARALGLIVPQSILLLADEVIE